MRVEASIRIPSWSSKVSAVWVSLPRTRSWSDCWIRCTGAPRFRAERQPPSRTLAKIRPYA